MLGLPAPVSGAPRSQIGTGQPIILPNKSPSTIDAETIKRFYIPGQTSQIGQPQSVLPQTESKISYPSSMTQRAENVKGITNPDFDRAHYALSEATASIL